MWLVALGGVVILLPALAVVVSLWGSPSVAPALGSVFIGALPFLVFMLLVRQAGEGGADEVGH